MKNLLFTLISLIICQVLPAQNVAWRHVSGGSEMLSIGVDSFGNISLLSTVEYTSDFDPGPGELIFSPTGEEDNALQRFNPDGTLQWAFNLGGPNLDYISTRIAVDRTGNTLMYGRFSNTVDFDPGPGETLLTAPGNGSGFLAKYDTGGNLVWAQVLYFTLEVSGFCLDKSDNILFYGQIVQAGDLDPGTGVYPVQGSFNGTNAYCKLDPGGNFILGALFGGSYLFRAATDGQNNLFFIGSYKDSTDMDPGPGVYKIGAQFNSQAIFVLKLDANGVFQWVREVEAGGNGSTIYCQALAAGDDGSCVVTGYFLKNIDLDPTPVVEPHISKGLSDIFILKLDADGNRVYGHAIGSTGLDTGLAPVMDADGNVYVTGYLSYQIDIDPGPDTVWLEPQIGDFDGFMVKFDPVGNYVWAKRYGQDGADYPQHLAIDSKRRLYQACRFGGAFNLGFAPGDDFLNSITPASIVLFAIDQENNYRGRVFLDLNNNQVQETGEPGLQNVVLELPGYNGFATTSSEGNYGIYRDLDADTIRPLAQKPYWTITPTFAVSDSLNQNNTFAVTFPAGLRDVAVSAVTRQTFRPGFETFVEISVRNDGVEEINNLSLTFGGFGLQPNLEVLTSNPAADVSGSNQLVWTIDTMPIAASAKFFVQLRTPDTTEVGLPIDLVIEAALAGDAAPDDNTVQVVSEVIAAYDPNDKLVFPTRIPVQEVDSALLYYTIRFQNTGNAAADFVILRDTLLADLDPTSLQVLGASHPYSWRLHGENIFEVRFDDINLPDSTTDLEGSQGFVAFTLKPRTGLGVGDTVYNRAGIYFDYNAVVMTPWAKAAIVMQSVAAHEPFGNTGVLKIYPNPAHGQCTVSSQGKLSGPGEMVLFDAGGKVCLRRQVAETGQPFELAGLPGVGLFFVKLKTEKGEMNGVLISN